MKTTKKIMFAHGALTAIAAAAILTACGGGGGGSSTIAPVVTPTPTVIASQLQLTVPTPPYAAGSEELKAFNYLNNLRKVLGLGLLAYSAELEKSAINHVNYIKANNIGGFEEDPLKPGFTGKDPTVRANFAGYSTNYAVSGGIAVGYNKTDAVQILVNSIYHRSVLFDQVWTDVGSGSYCVFDCQQDYLNMNFARKTATGQWNAPDFFMAYPFNNQTDVPVTFPGENPNPFPVDYPGISVYGKVGSPVSVAVQRDHDINLKSFTMTEAGQTTALEAWVYTMANDPNKLIGRNEAYLTPKSQLKLSTTYNMSVELIVDGKPMFQKWSFTTASTRR